MGRNRFFALAVTALAIALVVWPAAGVSAPRTEHPRTQTYSDATGDSGAAADISTVAVTLDAEDALTFTVTEPNRTALVSPDSLAILIDTDTNAATGASGGADYEIVVGPATVKLSKWAG